MTPTSAPRLRGVPGLWRVIPFDDRLLFHKVAALLHARPRRGRGASLSEYGVLGAVSRDKTPLHKVAAWSLLFCTLVHVAAHLYNYSQYHAAATAVWEKSVLGKESGLDPQPAYWEVRRGARACLLGPLGCV
jgi:hypothetical protein